MNSPIFDALSDVIGAAERRMDAAGVPRVVTIACPFCIHGIVTVQGEPQRCRACGGSGKTNVEAM